MSFKISHEAVLKRALSKGGDYADLFMERSYLTQAQLEGDRVERAVMGIDSGAGLRVIFNNRTVYAYTNNISDAGLFELADSLAAAVKRDAVGAAGLAPLQSMSAAPWVPIKVDPAGVSLDDKIALTRRGNETARKTDKRIRQVRVNYGDSRREIEIACSTGTIVSETRCQIAFIVHAVAADGEIIQTGYEPVGGTLGMELFDENPPEKIGEAAAKRAILMLEAPPAPAGRMTVVLSSEAGGTMIHEAVGHGLEADLAEEGLSVYAGKLGTQIANPIITVIDDATIPRARGSFLFDDEGIKAQKSVLIENGLLKSYMHSRLSAMKAGVESTGNGRKENYRHRPIVRMTTTMIQPGNLKPEDIVRGVERGLYVRKMGGGQVNTVNGDFVFEVTEGYLIEKGKKGHPVRNATLIGNGPAVLMAIDQLADDLGFGIGTCGKDGQGVPVSDAQPTLRIPEITVGGRG